MDLKDCKIYLVTDEKSCNGKDFYKCIEESIKGGVKIVQLREKNISTKDFYEKALKVKEICKNYEVLFIINDRLDIAQAVGADGVHLGQSDMPIEKAREILKDKFLIGATARNIEEAKKAEEASEALFGNGANNANMPTIEIEAETSILDVIILAGFAQSKGQAKTLIAQGGITLNDNKVEDLQLKITSNMLSEELILKKGKKGFCKLISK